MAVSSKVNQWTLLVGTLPIVFAIAAGGLHGLPVDAHQREELFLTAAQSFFAVAVLVTLSISVREAWMLFVLFWAQFIIGGLVPESLHGIERVGVGIVYLILGLVFAHLYGLLNVLVPEAFANVPSGLNAHAVFYRGHLLYFSFETLTTTGYGDIVPLHPVARSLANLESVIGQLFPATLLARLVSLELQGRRLDESVNKPSIG